MKVIPGSRNLLLDAAGIAAVVSCAAAFVWLTVLRGSGPATEIPLLRHEVAKLEADLSAVRTATAQRRAALAGYLEELHARGELPDGAPADEYFRGLAADAQRLGLVIRKQAPWGRSEYPGVIEQQFVYQVVVSLSGLMQLLHRIEHFDYWADVSFLQFGDETRNVNAAPGGRTANLVISFYTRGPTPDEADAADG